jgi:anion-transporting  ArsA/GET3 family ATPase
MAASRTRTLFVTGKGGAGKSFVAAELAREGAARGLRAAVVEAAAAETRARPRTPCAEGAAEPWTRIVLDPREALRRLLMRLLRFGFLSNRLMDSRTFSAVAAAAPGLYDLVRMDYLAELATGRAGGRFDLLVVDAPASGHAVAMLEAPRRIEELVPLGPAAAVARAARALTAEAASFRAVVVALPEELSITETAELHAALERIEVGAAPTVVNGVYPERATGDQTAWLSAHPAASSDARLHAARRERQLSLAARVASPGGPPVVLTRSFGTASLEASERARLFERLVPHDA